MIVESSNPAHSVADSRACREAFGVAGTAGGHRRRDDRDGAAGPLRAPAASQFEKPEATFFNLEFPHNTFHLRHPLFEPLPGTLAEPEIWARLVRALGVVGADDLRPLHGRRPRDRDAYAAAFFSELASNPVLGKVLPYVLYETLGPTLPEHLKGAAALWGLAQKAA